MHMICILFTYYLHIMKICKTYAKPMQMIKIKIVKFSKLQSTCKTYAKHMQINIWFQI